MSQVQAAKAAGIRTRRQREVAERYYSKGPAARRGTGERAEEEGVISKVADALQSVELQGDRLRAQLLDELRDIALRLGVGSEWQMQRTMDLANAAHLMIAKHGNEGQVIGYERVSVNWAMWDPKRKTVMYDGVEYPEDRIVTDNAIRVKALQHMARLTGTEAEMVVKLESGLLKNMRLGQEVEKEGKGNEAPTIYRIVRPEVSE
jgi:hypothetical protein